MEQGDPRGEFMQVQMALEKEGLSKAERQKVAQQEAALLKKHEKEWGGTWSELITIEEWHDGVDFAAMRSTPVENSKSRVYCRSANRSKKSLRAAAFNARSKSPRASTETGLAWTKRSKSGSRIMTLASHERG
jgi:hypothetical protein